MITQFGIAELLKFARVLSICTLAIIVFSSCKSEKKPGNEQAPANKVTFVTNGGSSVPSIWFHTGTIMSEPAAPARTYFSFEGWHSDPELTEIVIFPITVTQDITLYAKWEWTDGFEIGTPEQLNRVRYNLSGEYTVIADISLETYGNWAPIGSFFEPFTGKIAGNGHKITGMKISGITGAYAGLFGCVVQGEISDLTLEDIDITVHDVSSVGAITGYIYNGAITNSHSAGKIMVSSPYSSFNAYYTGGMAGEILYSAISDCYSAVDIVSSSASYSFLGGIAGILEYSIITNSYSAANITSSFSSYDSYSGGMAGALWYSVITDSHSTGNITASSTSSPSSVYTFASYLGGIAGEAANDSLIINSYSAGNVTLSSSRLSESYAGGIAGVLGKDSTINNSYNTGDVESYSSIYSISGGLAGLLSSNGIINNSYSTGNIAASSLASGSSYAGGIAGAVQRSGAISNSYSAGNIAASSLASDSSYAGGIAGAANLGAINNGAAIGMTVAAGDGAGRITGRIDNSLISNNFALEDMTAPGDAKFDDADTKHHGVDKTDDQLKDKSTYSDIIEGNGDGGLGWKFGSDLAAPWEMPDYEGYPILYWQNLYRFTSEN